MHYLIRICYCVFIPSGEFSQLFSIEKRYAHDRNNCIVSFHPEKNGWNCTGNYRAVNSWRVHIEFVSSGGSKKVVQTLESVQQSDQIVGLEGVGFFHLETMWMRNWSGVSSCLGEHYKENWCKLSWKSILILTHARTIDSAHKLQFERSRLDVRSIFIAGLEQAVNVALKICPQKLSDKARRNHTWPCLDWV